MVTRSETTVAAIRAACRALRPGGVVTVGLYESHVGGAEECAAVRAYAASLPPNEFAVTHIAVTNRTNAPTLLSLYCR